MKFGRNAHNRRAIVRIFPHTRFVKKEREYICGWLFEEESFIFPTWSVSRGEKYSQPQKGEIYSNAIVQECS